MLQNWTGDRALMCMANRSVQPHASTCILAKPRESDCAVLLRFPMHDPPAALYRASSVSRMDRYGGLHWETGKELQYPAGAMVNRACLQHCSHI